MPNQVIQYTEIRKSISDCREYRGLKLKNDLKVLLISDPNTEISATSLTVAVGCLNDPKGFPGLAHLCEHTLFSGTKKYPQENEFSHFVTKNGGQYCARTSSDYTNYYCSSKTDAFRPLLDRFSRFFYEPLFTENSVEKEIQAIDSEHEKNKADDDYRLSQLKKTLAVPNHPFNNFDSGNKQTLWDIPKKNKKKICHEVLKFYSKWYSSHLMNLAVLGKEDLNTLEEMVVSLFKDIRKKDISMPTWINPIYKKEQLATKTIVVPVKDIRKLHVDFLLKDQKPYYKSMPIDYLNSLFNDKGPNGISAFLIKNGWSTGALSGNNYEARGIEFYEMCAELTELGLGHVDDIVLLIFQYVNMLKQNGIVEWYHGEIKDILTMDFCFKDKEPPLEYVYTLTPQMIRYEMEDVLIAEHLIEEWNPKLINELLTYFTPDNMRITVISKTYENQTNAVEKYYGTQYSVFKLPEKTLKNWRDAGYCKDLGLPLSNQYLAQNYALVPIESNEPEIPQLFHNTSFMRVWLKTDTVFRLPKAHISIEFYSPIVEADPFNCNIMDIFVRLFNDHFNLQTCYSNKAILHTTMKSRTFGFNMKFNGFNHKMHHLMKRIIKKLFTFKIDPKQLEIVKDEKIRELNNMDMEQPFRSATRYTSLILSEATWTPFELLRCFHNINVKVVRCFVDNFLKHMFIEAILYGNLNKQMALLLIHQLKETCLLRGGFRPLVPREMIRSREVEMNDGESLLYERVNSFHSSSCIYINLQCGVQTAKNSIMVSLFNQIIEDSCINVLRTQEKLGYLVKSRIQKSNGVLYIGILVQSERDPTFVHTRIENYLSTVEGLLKDLSETEFDDNKDSLSIKLAEKPKGQIEQAKIYRSEIINQSYNFNRVEMEIEALKLITKKDIIDFYNEKISHTGPKRRKLAVHIKSEMNDVIDKLKSSSKIPANDDSFTTLNIQKINDIAKFKKSHGLYPVPKSFAPIESNRIEYPDDTDFAFYEEELLRRKNEMSAAASFSS